MLTWLRMKKKGDMDFEPFIERLLIIIFFVLVLIGVVYAIIKLF